MHMPPFMPCFMPWPCIISLPCIMPFPCIIAWQCCMNSIIDCGFMFFGEFIQLGNLFRLKKRFGIRQSLFFDSLQAGHLIVCQIELFLPREKARGALRLELHGTHLPALLYHAGLALLGGTGRSRGSFLALLSPKRDTACDHQRHAQTKNCLSHISLSLI